MPTKNFPELADMYGPTTGDRLRLADTDLIIEVERDLSHYGEEVKFGGAKSYVMAWVNPKDSVGWCG